MSQLRRNGKGIAAGDTLHPLGMSTKSLLDQPYEKKLHTGGGMLHLQDHSASEPEQTIDNRKLVFQMAS